MAAFLSTSPIKRSAAHAELAIDAFSHRPGKMTRFAHASDVRGAGRRHVAAALDDGQASDCTLATPAPNSFSSCAPAAAAAALPHSFSSSSSSSFSSAAHWTPHSTAVLAGTASSTSFEPYKRTLQTSTGSRMQFRNMPSSASSPSLSNAARTPGSSPTRPSSRSTPPRQPKYQVGAASFSSTSAVTVSSAVSSSTSSLSSSSVSTSFSANPDPSSAAIEISFTSSSVPIQPERGQNTTAIFKFGEQPTQQIVRSPFERENMAGGRRTIHGGKGRMSFGGAQTGHMGVYQQSSFSSTPSHQHRQRQYPQHLQHPQHSQHPHHPHHPRQPKQQPASDLRSTSGISPALKALQFSPALRPASPPTLALPTLRQLDDEAMLDDDDFNKFALHDTAPEQQLQLQQPSSNWSRQTPDYDMMTPRASPSCATAAKSNSLDLKQSGQQQQQKQSHHGQPPLANGLLHQAILTQHLTSVTSICPPSSNSGSSSSSGGMNRSGSLARSVSFDVGASQSSNNLGPTIRWNFRDSPRVGLKRASSLSISSVLSDVSNDEAIRPPLLNGSRGNIDMFGDGPSPSPLLVGGLMHQMGGYGHRGSPTTFRPNMPEGGYTSPKMLCEKVVGSLASLTGASSNTAVNPLSFSPVLSMAFGQTPAPSESSSVDEDFEL